MNNEEIDDLARYDRLLESNYTLSVELSRKLISKLLTQLRAEHELNESLKSDDALATAYACGMKAAQNQWQPIATAPHVLGKRFLVTKDCGEGTRKSVSIAYRLDKDEWYYSDGNSVKSLEEYGYRITHWQPLPQPPENMSETPIMDEVARDCQYLSGQSQLWRHQDACAFLEKGKELERKLTSAQQTIHDLQHGKYGTIHMGMRIAKRDAIIAQKDGELRALKESLKLARKQLLERNGLCKDSDNAVAIQINHALSTTSPSAVVPLDAVIEAIEALPTPELADADTGQNYAGVILELKRTARRYNMTPTGRKFKSVEDLQKHYAPKGNQ